MQKIDLSKISKIHFIGIGGSSMCGLASFMLNRGMAVSGSDNCLNEATEILSSAGANINSPHSSGVIRTFLPDLVVYTIAIHDDNPEYLEAEELGIPIIERAEFLGRLMEDYKTTVAVAGTHGKTTTTSMIASILLENNLDPSVHIGGKLPLIDGNTKIGKSDFFVSEACEYNDSFLHFKSQVAVILNVEHDHVDYFKTFEQFKDSFRKFIGLVPKDGCVIVCADDENALEIAKGATCQIVRYGIGRPDYDWGASGITFDDSSRATFTVLRRGLPVCELKLGTVGIHNVRNALAAVAAAVACGLSPQDCVLPLAQFTGANRRFEFKGFVDGVKVVDDYAHHPTEIVTTLAAARAGARGRIIVTYQPHTYTRTRELLGDFAHAFGDADVVVMADIYASRETDPGDIKIQMLVDAINAVSGNCVFKSGFEAIAEYVREIARPGDLVISMGAGDIFKVANLLLGR